MKITFPLMFSHDYAREFGGLSRIMRKFWVAIDGKKTAWHLREEPSHPGKLFADAFINGKSYFETFTSRADARRWFINYFSPEVLK